MPQQALFLVPFAALQDKSDQYLIQQHTISISPQFKFWISPTNRDKPFSQPPTSWLQATLPCRKSLFPVPMRPSFCPICPLPNKKRSPLPKPSIPPLSQVSRQPNKRLCSRCKPLESFIWQRTDCWMISKAWAYRGDRPGSRWQRSTQRWTIDL